MQQNMETETVACIIHAGCCDAAKGCTFVSTMLVDTLTNYYEMKLFDFSHVNEYSFRKVLRQICKAVSLGSIAFASHSYVRLHAGFSSTFRQVLFHDIDVFLNKDVSSSRDLSQFQQQELRFRTYSTEVVC